MPRNAPTRKRHEAGHQLLPLHSEQTQLVATSWEGTDVGSGTGTGTQGWTGEIEEVGMVREDGPWSGRVAAERILFTIGAAESGVSAHDGYIQCSPPQHVCLVRPHTAS